MRDQPTPSGSSLDGVVEWLKQRQANQPSFGAEMRAMARATREDLFNNLILPFPGSQQVTRENGAPGSPTPQQTTEALVGRDVDRVADVLRPQAEPAAETGPSPDAVAAELARMRGEDHSQSRGR